mgnify:CR=1 FL=1
MMKNDTKHTYIYDDMDDMMKFRKNAILDGLCDEWSHMWGACGKDKASLMQLGMMQQSIPYVAHYAHEGRGVTKEYMKEVFASYINGHVIKDADGVRGYSYGLFVDYHGDDTGTLLLDALDVVSLMWCDNIDILVDETRCPVLYVSNMTHANIACDGCNMVRIYLFDESTVTLTSVPEDSMVTIYKYGEGCDVIRGRKCRGNVKEFCKTLRL